VRLFLAGGAATAAVLVAAAVHSPSAGAASVPRASIWTETVRKGSFLRQVPVRGTLVSERVQWLSATSEARVAKIAARPGAAVRADTVIIVLENAELELASLEAERQAASAESTLLELDVNTDAEMGLREAHLARLRSDADEARRRATAAGELASAGLMPELDHQSARSKATGVSDQLSREETLRTVLESGRGRQLAARRAEVRRLRAIADFHRQQRAALQVRAGLDGVVQDISLEAGMWVPRGTVLARIAEPGRLKAKVKVAEGDAREIQPGLRVRFEGTMGELLGRVKRIDPAVSGGEVELDVMLEGAPPPGARPDQALTGHIEIERLENVTFVARPAGVRERSSASVFRLGPDRRYAERRRVEFGRGSSIQIEVLAGLSPGDEIVVSETSSWPASERMELE
jgi:multidrug efflux pump subunit AcrA (membrane-fusion protein)